MLSKFCLRFVFFLIPFYLVVAINYVVDPFNYNRQFDLGMNKDTVSMKMNYRLYKLLEYQHLKTPNLLLGDSRIFAFSTNEIKKVSGEDYYNFAYGGASLPECIETFHYATSLCPVKKVYFGIPFNLFSETNSKNLFAEAIKTSDNPIQYHLNSFVLKVSFYNLYNTLFHKNLYSESPDIDKEAFWKSQIIMTGNSYSVFNWPSDFIRQLKEIKQYCDEKGIELTFIIPPTHVDLQNQVKVYHLEKQYADYKKTLRSISAVIDYDTISAITINKDNFKDPYHCNEKIVDEMIHEIWGPRALN